MKTNYKKQSKSSPPFQFIIHTQSWRWSCSKFSHTACVFLCRSSSDVGGARRRLQTDPLGRSPTWMYWKNWSNLILKKLKNFWKIEIFEVQNSEIEKIFKNIKTGTKKSSTHLGILPCSCANIQIIDVNLKVEKNIFIFHANLKFFTECCSGYEKNLEIFEKNKVKKQNLKKNNFEQASVFSTFRFFNWN